ncbi:MAG: hypothetical protein VKI81_03485 [Synechococcaceae cyanobacterium]|nr:hypothetical protein [Synechococcaceae cyanobacterium]
MSLVSPTRTAPRPFVRRLAFRPGMRRRPYSMAAIVLGLLTWGIGIKLGASLMTRHLEFTAQSVETTDSVTGRHVHPRRR